MAIYNIDYVNESFLDKFKVDYDAVIYAGTVARKILSKSDSYSKRMIYIYNNNEIKKYCDEHRYLIGEFGRDEDNHGNNKAQITIKRFINDLNDSINNKNIQAIAIGGRIKIKNL